MIVASDERFERVLDRGRASLAGIRAKYEAGEDPLSADEVLVLLGLAEIALLPQSRNHLVTVGVVGCKRAYLNVTPEDALTRYRRDEPHLGGDSGLASTVSIFSFTDEFRCYDAESIDRIRGCVDYD